MADGSGAGRPGRGRRLAVRALLVVGAVCAALGLVAGYTNRTVLDGPTFADRVDEVRRDPAVAEQAGAAIAASVLAARPDLVALAPLVQDVSVRVAGGPLLSAPTRRAAQTTLEALTEADSDQVVLRIVDVGVVVTGVLAQVAPERAPNAGEISVTLADIGSQAFAEATIALARAVGVLAWLLPVLALVAFAGAIALSADRWRAATSVGWALAWSALGLGAVLLVGGFLVRRLDGDTIGSAVTQAGWQIMVRPLWWGVAVLGLIGVAIVLACGSTTPLAVRAQVRRALRTVARPETTMGRILRAVLAAVVGLAAILDPLGLLEPLVALAGVVVVLLAAAEIAEIAGVDRAAADPATAPDGGRSRRHAVGWVVGALAAVVAVAGVVTLARPAGDLDASAAGAGAGEVCNGHAELCDRTFDDVAYLGSHNAMSVAGEPGWFLGEQADSIPVQLDQGVRALLVDVWPGVPSTSPSFVRTAPAAYAEARAIAEEELGPETVDAALRIADSVAGTAAGPEGLYLCHGLCETGSTSFPSMLADLRGWLVAHPDEVVTLFIEDHAESVAIAADIEAAGLDEFAYQPVVGQPWPTLGEMVRAGKRLVVMLEEGDGGTAAPWMVNGFEHTQDTPYTFPTVASFSCAANRGPADAPLFLLNHWLAGFDALVTSAQQVNVVDVLLPRAQQCEQERGQIPNFVALNYVAIGDGSRVVDELNGVVG